jgi:hypothetical protein
MTLDHKNLPFQVRSKIRMQSILLLIKKLHLRVREPIWTEYKSGYTMIMLIYYLIELSLIIESILLKTCQVVKTSGLIVIKQSKE